MKRKKLSILLVTSFIPFRILLSFDSEIVPKVVFILVFRLSGTLNHFLTVYHSMMETYGII